jgi:hypothetical protein
VCSFLQHLPLLRLLRVWDLRAQKKSLPFSSLLPEYVEEHSSSEESVVAPRIVQCSISQSVILFCVKLDLPDSGAFIVYVKSIQFTSSELGFRKVHIDPDVLDMTTDNTTLDGGYGDRQSLFIGEVSTFCLEKILVSPWSRSTIPESER